MRLSLGLSAVLLVGGLAGWQIVGGPAAEEPARPRGWDLTPPDPGALPITAKGRLPGIYPAGSRVKDDKAPGGFGPCDNWPVQVGARPWGKEGDVSLVAFPAEPVAYFRNLGIALRLVNRTGRVAAFAACDSRLYIVQEALDEHGRWCEIEDPPCAICGNSFHRVFLSPGQCWEFKARRYAGPVRTKLRFRLDPAGEQDTAPPIYSNEFDGQITAGQLRRGPDRAALRRAFRSGDPKEAGVVGLLAQVVAREDLAVPGSEVQPRGAAMRLADFGPAAAAALPALQAAMKGKDPVLRATAAYAAWRVTGKTEAPVATLAAALRSREDRVRWEAALWLKEMGPPARDAVPALCEALAGGDRDSRAQAAEALGAIRGRPDVAVPALARALKDKDWFVRSYAGQALGRFGAAARPAVPRLKGSLKDPDGHARVAAALALWRVERRVELAVPALVETLRGGAEGSYAPESAAEALGKIGPAARAAVPDLTAALRKENRGLRIRAAGALWKITGQAEPALPVLIGALRDGESVDNQDTHDALGVLEEMGPKARAAVPALLAARARAGALAREAVERALRAIDPEAARKVGLR